MPLPRIRLMKRLWVWVVLVAVMGSALLARYLYYHPHLLSTIVAMDGQEEAKHDPISIISPRQTLDPPPPHQNISQRFQQRRNILRQACQKYKSSGMFNRTRTITRTLLGHWPQQNISLEYCPIEKVGSRTWLNIIKRFNTERRAFESENHVETKETKTSKLVFVREPYSHLLSGYVCKLFKPNPVFWKVSGRYTVQNFRDNASAESLRCGHDVTFPEFIRYVVRAQKTLEHRNNHFTPIHDHCSICKADYTYIGHLETIKEDMSFLFDVVHLNKSHIPKSYDPITITANANWVFGVMQKGKGITSCMTKYEACLRLWKNWHIRGLISKHEPLPLTPGEAETISRDDFIKLALEASERSGSKEEKRRQKTEALIEAFASLPLELRLQVQEMLTLDFALFGFDPKPEALFPRVVEQHNASFSYFDVRVGEKKSG